MILFSKLSFFKFGLGGVGTTVTTAAVDNKLAYKSEFESKSMFQDWVSLYVE